MLKKIDEAYQVLNELLGIRQFRTRVFFAAIPSNRPKSLSHRTKKRCLSHMMLLSSNMTSATCGGRYFLWDRLLVRISHQFTRTAQGPRPGKGRPFRVIRRGSPPNRDAPWVRTAWFETWERQSGDWRSQAYRVP